MDSLALGKLLKNRRIELGFSLRYVASRVQTSAATLLRWENGKVENMSREQIALLSKILHISIGTFFDSDETIENAEMTKRKIALEKDIEAITDIESLRDIELLVSLQKMKKEGSK